MRKEAVPVEGFGRFIPGPVGLFRIGKDDARVFVLLIGLLEMMGVPNKALGYSDARVSAAPAGAGSAANAQAIAIPKLADRI